MKKNYEKDEALIILCYLLFLGLSIYVIATFNNTYKTYYLINSVVVSDNTVLAVVNNDELKLLQATKYLYINDKKRFIKIDLVTKKVLKRKGKYYHEVYIRVKFDKKLKVNDYLKLTVLKHDEKLYKLLNSCWK